MANRIKAAASRAAASRAAVNKAEARRAVDAKAAAISKVAKTIAVVKITAAAVKGGSPTPSGVPNEGRGMASQKYKGGRQGQGGIPNPDDKDDFESAGSFRGTAEQELGADDDQRGLDAGQQRGQNLNSQSRQPNENRNPRRAESSDDETRNPV